MSKDINRVPSQDELLKLWELSKAFIIEQNIICEEATYEDGPVVDAPILIGEICDLIGYAPYEE